MVGFIALIALIVLFQHWQWVVGAYLLFQVVKFFSEAYEMEDDEGKAWRNLESEWNTRVTAEQERIRAKEDAIERAFKQAMLNLSEADESGDAP